MYASEFPSAENWYLAGSISGLDKSKAVEALTYAGGEYLARGDLGMARTIYSETHSLMRDLTVAEAVDPAALIKLRTGSTLTDLYAGIGIYSEGNSTALNMSIDFSKSATFAADPKLTLSAYEELVSFYKHNKILAIGEESLRDSLRDDL